MKKFPEQARVLSRLRKEKGLTLEELETLTGINDTRLFRLENGRIELKVSELVVLENFFNTEILEQIENEYLNMSGLNVPTVCA